MGSWEATYESDLSYEEAAVVPHGALTALHFIRDRAGIKSGQRVLINGASGGIGQYAVQLAKSFGAEVTGVCSTAKLELVKSLGADRVIDYTQEDFTQNGQTYDVILDTARVTLFLRCKGSLKEGGRYLLPVFGMRGLFQMLGTSIFVFLPLCTLLVGQCTVPGQVVEATGAVSDISPVEDAPQTEATTTQAEVGLILGSLLILSLYGFPLSIAEGWALADPTKAKKQPISESPELASLRITWSDHRCALNQPFDR